MRDWKTFTPEELKELRNNPYVKSATEKMVRFTVAFKEEFWRRYNEECQQPIKINYTPWNGQQKKYGTQKVDTKKVRNTITSATPTTYKVPVWFIHVTI